jgi:phosphoglycerate kinase
MAAPQPPLADVVAQLLSPACDIATQDFRGQRVLVRADLNVPLARDGSVADRSRLDAALPTLRQLADGGARVIVASHLGRPEPGKESEAEMRRRDSLRPVAALLADALGSVFIGMADDCAGASACNTVSRLRDGQARLPRAALEWPFPPVVASRPLTAGRAARRTRQVCLLENTRFEPGDVADDPTLAAHMATLCDVFVLDGFGVCHRAQASVTGVARAAPRRFPGPLVRRELQFLGKALDTPVRPFAVVIGGMKVRDKIGVLWALIKKADVILVGGKMAFTFLAARGIEVGATQIEPDFVPVAREMEAAAAAAGVKLLLPCDVVVSSSADEPRDVRTVQLRLGCCTKEQPCLPPGSLGMDIGPAAAAEFAAALAPCRTVLWNGPMGRFEVPAFAEGTHALMRALADAHGRGAVTVAAGGDSVAALNGAGLADAMSHVSTGGGASLQLLEGKSMPGLEALLG